MCNLTDHWEDHMNASLPYNDTLDLSWDGILPNSSLCFDGSVYNSSMQDKKGKHCSIPAYGLRNS